MYMKIELFNLFLTVSSVFRVALILGRFATSCVASSRPVSSDSCAGCRLWIGRAALTPYYWKAQEIFHAHINDIYNDMDNTKLSECNF